MTPIEYVTEQLHNLGCTCEPVIVSISAGERFGDLQVVATHEVTCRLYFASKSRSN